MFLIRIAFWLALIVLLLPTDPRQQEKLAATTVATAKRVATFCERNETVCERGAEYWALFKQKLEFGAKLAYGVAIDHLVGKPAVSETTAPATNAPARVERARGTLLPDDLAPEWRGKQVKTGA